MMVTKRLYFFITTPKQGMSFLLHLVPPRI